MAKRNHLYSNHHILQKSAGGSNHQDNLIRLKNTKHQALHTLFGVDNNTPISQLSYLFEIVKKPLEDDIKNEIQKILDLAENAGYDVYKKHCIK